MSTAGYCFIRPATTLYLPDLPCLAAIYSCLLYLIWLPFVTSLPAAACPQVCGCRGRPGQLPECVAGLGGKRAQQEVGNRQSCDAPHHVASSRHPQPGVWWADSCHESARDCRVACRCAGQEQYWKQGATGGQMGPGLVDTHCCSVRCCPPLPPPLCCHPAAAASASAAAGHQAGVRAGGGQLV